MPMLLCFFSPRSPARQLLKVTVDVRSTASGVLTKQFAGPDDEIMVGDPLAMLEAGAEAVAAAAAGAVQSETDAPPTATEAPAAPAAPAAPVAPVAPVATPAAAAHAGRVPMIRFRYGAGRPDPAEAAGAQVVDPNDGTLPSVAPTFGRPPMSVEEMEMIEFGGIY
jgi:pyruvate/2-oxoglutarate dehydrogenase complex dihydrolipoamide acyltransferase (E2) component